MRVDLVVASVAVVAVACGANEPVATTSTTTTTAPATTPTVSLSTSTSVPDVTTTTSLQVDVELSGGEVTGPGTFEVGLGESVDVWILSDIDDEIHVHGYDLFYDLEAGVPHHLTFVADVPGIFEVETHRGQTRLFEIEVSG